MDAQVYVRALFDYNAAGNFSKNGLSDISIRKNDLILLLETLPNGWIKGQKEDGKVGYIPSNYVKRATDLVSNAPAKPVESKPIEVAPTPKTLLMAMYDYFSTGVTMNGCVDMALKKGDIIILLETFPNGWVKGELNGKIGVVPSTHITKYDASKKVEAPKPVEVPKTNNVAIAPIKNTITNEYAEISKVQTFKKAENGPSNPPVRSGSALNVQSNVESSPPTKTKLTSNIPAKNSQPQIIQRGTYSQTEQYGPLPTKDEILKTSPTPVKTSQQNAPSKTPVTNNVAPTQPVKKSQSAQPIPKFESSKATTSPSSNNGESHSNGLAPNLIQSRGKSSTMTSFNSIKPLQTETVSNPPEKKAATIDPHRAKSPIVQRPLSPSPPAVKNSQPVSSRPAPASAMKPPNPVSPTPVKNVQTLPEDPRTKRQGTRIVAAVPTKVSVMPFNNNIPDRRAFSPPPVRSNQNPMASPPPQRASSVEPHPMSSPPPVRSNQNSIASPPPQRPLPPPQSSKPPKSSSESSVSFMIPMEDSPAPKRPPRPPRLLALPTDNPLPDQAPVEPPPVCARCGKPGHTVQNCDEGEPEEQKEGITFVSHRGKEMIKAATLEKLVERLYSENVGTSDFITEYVEIFLMTYRTFTKPKNVMMMILNTYNDCLFTTGDEAEENNRKAKRLRICNFLKRWVEQHFDDFETDSELMDAYSKFIATIEATGYDETVVAILKRAAEKGKWSLPKPSQSNLELPKPLLPREINSLFDIDPVEFARQLSMMEFAAYVAITPKEFLLRQWNSKASMQEEAPNLLRMIERFNHFSMWVSYAVTKESNLKKRCQLVCRFLRVAKEVQVLNNFNALYEIIAGLQQSSVHRLKKTWELVRKEKEFSIFEELMELTATSSNFTAYRERLHNSNPPCIPYLGVYQSDLTFIQDGNPDVLENGYINFFKRRLVAEVIREIQTYQQVHYHFVPVNSIVEWIQNQMSIQMDENTIYNVSLIIEPREGDAKERERSKSKTVSARTRSTTNLGKKRDSQKGGSVGIRDKDGSHVSWNPGDPNNSKKLSKLAKFFGEDDVDFEFYQRWSSQNDQPKSILDDVEMEQPARASLKPTTVEPADPSKATSAVDLTPEQVEEYKRKQKERYELEQRMVLSSEEYEEIEQNQEFVYEDNTGWI